MDRQSELSPSTKAFESGKHAFVQYDGRCTTRSVVCDANMGFKSAAKADAGVYGDDRGVANIQTV